MGLEFLKSSLGLVAMKDRVFLKVSIIIGALGCLVIGSFFFSITSDVSLIPDLVYSEDDHHENTARIYKDLGALAERRNDFEQALKLYQISLSHKPDAQELQDRIAEVCNKLNSPNIQLAQNTPSSNIK